jgi:hypothetical protein
MALDSRPRKRRRRVAIPLAAASAIAAIGLAATSANAAAHLPRPHALNGGGLRALPAWVTRPSFSGLRSTAATTALPGQVQLQTDPVTITIDGVRYQEMVAMGALLSGANQQAGVGLSLVREVPAGSTNPTAIQEHDYDWSPFAKVGVTADLKTMAVTFDTGKTILPSQITTAFTATSVQTEPCTLANGRQGTLRFATGTLASQTFKLVTPTAPFFGTLTTKPMHAAALYDPGCTSGPAATGSSSAPCPDRETIETSPFGINQWFAETDPTGTLAAEGAARFGQPSPIEFSDHLVEALVPRVDLPKPATWATGASARLLTAGDPFMSGSSTFHSAKAPAVTTGLSCTWNGRTHDYVRTVYTGQLVHDEPQLTALFDTGHVGQGAIAAKLILVRWTS